MEGLNMKSFDNVMVLTTLILLVSVVQVSGQITAPCTTSMVNSFTPCLNFITQNSSTPTSDCCNSLKSLTGVSMGCACLIVSGNMPFQIPINRTLAISLPRACNMGGVPVQCKASATPLPAPGPVSFGPVSSPTATPSAPEPSPSTLAPESDTTSSTPESPPETTTGTAGVRPVLTPNSAAKFSTVPLPSILLLVVGILAY